VADLGIHASVIARLDRAIQYPSALPANSRQQIRKAQVELRRLDCFQGKTDGKLRDQTRQAVKDLDKPGDDAMSLSPL
jgi:hypothetical protein